MKVDVNETDSVALPISEAPSVPFSESEAGSPKLEAAAVAPDIEGELNAPRIDPRNAPCYQSKLCL